MFLDAVRGAAEAGWKLFRELIFFVIIVNKLEILVNEMFVIHCAGSSLQFSLIREYASRSISARWLSFYRAGSRGMTGQPSNTFGFLSGFSVFFVVSVSFFFLNFFCFFFLLKNLKLL
jgi:hypothetical protein